MHGPQSGIILCRNKFAELLEKTVIETGHASLKKNVMAALAVTFHEVSCPEFQEYAQAVMDNAKKLENGLRSAGIETIWANTENHLVLAKLPENIDVNSTVAKLEQAGLLVKAEILSTTDERISYQILRLSSLDPTTRGLLEEDMFTVGKTLGEFLKSRQDSAAINSVQQMVKEIIEGLPLFSEDWLPADEIIRERDTELVMKSMIYGM